ncbi:hypothetical protein HK099_000182 [Clydaea vesicula]|uniref:Major facilitator superfamily (MFS) profile domain-containing protein n=1 Tax=Clydaea vesicula TaxID=447962 RepID=A0AAD5XXH9_9FUNG|nr:hypothetical protein HK099_000182 [Clydaea vesicula]
MLPENDSASTSFYLYLCTFVSLLVGFQFGFNSGVINQPRKAITKCTQPDSGIFVNCIPMDDLFNGVIGGLIGGFLAAKYGRKAVLIYNNLFFIIGGLFLSLGNEVVWLCVGRVLLGIGSGIGTVVLPTYISELAPNAYRGMFGTFNQLSIVVGVFTSLTIGIPLSTPEYWRILFSLTLVPSLFQILLMPYCTETPKWLASRGRIYDAREALVALRGSNDIEEELEEILLISGNVLESPSQHFEEGIFANDNNNNITSPIRSQINNTGIQWPLSTLEMFQCKALRRVLISAFSLQFAQQFSGINVATFYSTTIFENSYSPETAIKLTPLLSIIIMIGTIISLFLIEKLGRKSLLITSMTGMSISSFLIALPVEQLPSLIVCYFIVFTFFFALGLGSIPWLILPELIPVYALGPASGIATAINWGGSFIIALFSPVLISVMGYQLFFIFTVILVLMIVLTYFVIPETKGKTAEELVGYYVPVDEGHE